MKPNYVRAFGSKKFTLNPGVRGLSINRKAEGLISDIFVLEDELDRVMLTIGHEIGHVLTTSLRDKRDEEAKAFAFELAWLQTIHKFNILGLKECMNINMLNPAVNGLHNTALGLVKKELNALTPLQVFQKFNG